MRKIVDRIRDSSYNEMIITKIFILMKDKKVIGDSDFGLIGNRIHFIHFDYERMYKICGEIEHVLTKYSEIA